MSNGCKTRVAMVMGQKPDYAKVLAKTNKALLVRENGSYMTLGTPKDIMAEVESVGFPKDEEPEDLIEDLKNEIAKYLCVNSVDQLNGGYKAEFHINISTILCRMIIKDKYKLGNVGDAWVSPDTYMKVHDHLADVLTNHLDTVIDFPLNLPWESIKRKKAVYVDRFIGVIEENWDKLKELVLEDFNLDSNFIYD